MIVLVHADLVPPKRFQNRREWESSECKTEFDVQKALLELGHQIEFIPVYDDLSLIRKSLTEFKPHLAFNILEEFNGQVLFEQNVVSYLELLGLKYTGCNPRGLMICRDKGLAKKILKYHGIKTPEFRLFPNRRKVSYKNLFYPLFVKTLNQEGSFGISQNSIVRSEEALKERVEYLHDTYGVDVLVERYIEGRELYVSVMGNERPKTFPVWELFFNEKSFHGEKIATHQVKWNLDFRQRHGIHSGPAKNLSEQSIKKIETLCKKAYLALGISGYARMDLRLSPENEVYFIEANPNPDIGYKEDFSDALQEAGYSYEEVIAQILKMGLLGR